MILPTEITGCILWLDGGDIASLYVDAGVTNVSSDGQSIYRWADKSSSGNHANQATSANRPAYKTAILNGKSIVRFDGTNDLLQLTSNLSDATCTIFAVATNNGGSGYGTISAFRELSLYAKLGGSGQWGSYANTDIPYGSALATTHRILSVVARNYNDVDLVQNGSKITKTNGVAWPARTGSAIGADPNG